MLPQLASLQNVAFCFMHGPTHPAGVLLLQVAAGLCLNQCLSNVLVSVVGSLKVAPKCYDLERDLFRDCQTDQYVGASAAELAVPRVTLPCRLSLSPEHAGTGCI